MKDLDKYIYLDHSATTPVDPEVYAAMEPFMINQFGNASSLHTLGRRSRNAIEIAREQVATLIGASRSSEIVFTSGATESNNQAIKGLITHYRQKSPQRDLHLITCATEHHAVLHPCQYLEKHGLKVTYLSVDRYGRVSLADIQSAVSDETVLISLMHANNEIGTIHPIDKICQIAKNTGISVHSDAVQSVGKIPVNVEEIGLDLLSISAHKFNGPKGVGCLYVRRRQRINNLLHGGEHERNRRAGTENVAGIVGLGKAAEIVHRTLEQKFAHITQLAELLRQGLLNRIEKVFDNSPPNCHERIPGIVSLVFTNVSAENLILRLDMEGICVSSGSACASGSMEPSHVIAQLGINAELAQSTVRFSVGHTNTVSEIETTIEIVSRVVSQIRALKLT
ncbi:cysteine desulfurase NifS [Candidatus Poribacteria bacterium]|nr:cysteine desulfurase NifS [Candidatus Poribacteria bacterium]OUT63208.1 MAG: cysteine desulfurase NifS [bacterium TMED15]